MSMPMPTMIVTIHSKVSYPMLEKTDTDEDHRKPAFNFKDMEWHYQCYHCDKTHFIYNTYRAWAGMQEYWISRGAEGDAW